MRSVNTLLFALGVLFMCSLFATMMATHHSAERFADAPPNPAVMADMAAVMERLKALPMNM